MCNRWDEEEDQVQVQTSGDKIHLHWAENINSLFSLAAQEVNRSYSNQFSLWGEIIHIFLHCVCS